MTCYLSRPDTLAFVSNTPYSNLNDFLTQNYANIFPPCTCYIIVQSDLNCRITLVCLIDVLGHISILGGKFSNINKRPGPNNHPGGMI